MPRGMVLRDRIPAAMLDRYTSFRTDRLETQLDLGHLVRREACLPPGKNKARRRFPRRDPADFENFSIGERFRQASTRPWFEGENARRARRKSKKSVRPPP